MADEQKEKSPDQILQAFDALSSLYQARASVTRRSTSLPLPRSGSSSSKDGDDAAAEEARPRPRPLLRRRLSPRSPFGWSKAKLDRNESYDHEQEEGDDAALVVIVKSKGLSLMLPFQSRSPKLSNKEDDDYDDEAEEYDDDSSHSTATPDADGGEKSTKGITSWGSIRAASSHIGMRRMGCIFSLEVVAAQGLPPSLNGLRVAVTVRRKETRDGAVQTMPARVQMGAAYFDEELYVRCHLYGAGGGAAGKPLSFEPRPFVMSLIAISAPELDFGRSTVDLSLFAKEFTDTYQQGECVRQWDMVFPLAGKAKGGELVVKLAFESIDDGGTGGSFNSQRNKLRRSSVSNMLTPKIIRAKTPKMGVSSLDSRGIDSLVLDEVEPEPTPVVEMEEQHKEPECKPADDEPIPVVDEKEDEPTDPPIVVAKVKEEEQQREPEHEQPTSVVEVKEEDQQKETEHEPTDEPTLVPELVEEEQQREPEHEPADEPSPVVEVKEEEQQREPQHELTCESTPVVEMKEEEEQDIEPEHETLLEPTLIVDVKEEEHQIELEQETPHELTPISEVKEEEEQKKEPEYEPTHQEPTLVDGMEEEQQREPQHEAAHELSPIIEVPEHEPPHEPTAVAKVNEDDQEIDLEHEPTLVAEVKEGDQHKEPEHEPTNEPTPEAKVNEEEQQKELEHEQKNTQENDDLELPEFHVMDQVVEGQKGKVELKEEVEAKKGSEEEEEEVSLVASIEHAKVVTNGIEEKFIEAITPNIVSDAILDVVEPVDAKTQPEEVTKTSLDAPKHVEDKGATSKSSGPRFKWRTVAVLVPIAVTFSKTLGANR